MRTLIVEKEKLLFKAPVLAQFEQNGMFNLALLAMGEKSLYLYDDTNPSGVDGETSTYLVKREVALEDIKCVVIQKFKHHKAVRNYMRLNVVTKNINDCQFIYFLKRDKKYIKPIIKKLKKIKKIKVLKNTVDLKSQVL